MTRTKLENTSLSAPIIPYLSLFVRGRFCAGGILFLDGVRSRPSLSPARSRTPPVSASPSAAGKTLFIYFINGISINDQPGVHSFESFSFIFIPYYMLFFLPRSFFLSQI